MARRMDKYSKEELKIMRQKSLESQEQIRYENEQLELAKKKQAEAKRLKDQTAQTLDLEKELKDEMATKGTIMSKNAQIQLSVVDTMQKQIEKGDITQKQLDLQTGIMEDIRAGNVDIAGIQKIQKDNAGEMTDEFEKWLKVEEKRLIAQEAGNELMGELDGALGGIISTAKEMFALFLANPIAAFALAAAKALIQFSGQLDEIGEKFGVIGVKNFSADLMAADQQMAKLGYDTGEAGNMAQQLSDNFGMSFNEAVKLAPEIGKLSKTLGLSTEQGTALIGAMTTVSGVTPQVAMDTAKMAEQLAVANGVAPGAVMKDIADNTAFYAKYSKDGGKNIMKAAVQAKKLGMSLADVESTMESMTDFQSSTEAAMAASVMIGRQINVQKLQEASLMGDAEAVMAEQVRLLGSQAEWNELLPMQQRNLAEALGLSHEKAAELVGRTEDLAEVQGELNEQGIENMVPQDTMSSLTKLMGTLTSLGLIFSNALGPPLNFVVGVFGEMIGMVAGVIEGVNAMIGPMGTAAVVMGLFGKRALWAAITGVWAGLKWLWAIPFVGPGLAVAAGIMGAAAIYKQVNKAKAISVEDAMIPSKGPVVSTEKGTFQGIPEDDVIMGTNLTGGGGGGKVDMTPVVSAISALKSELTSIKSENVQLRKDMAEYFGLGGTAIKGIGKSTVTALADSGA